MGQDTFNPGTGLGGMITLAGVCGPRPVSEIANSQRESNHRISLRSTDSPGLGNIPLAPKEAGWPQCFKGFAFCVLLCPHLGHAGVPSKMYCGNEERTQDINEPTCTGLLEGCADKLDEMV